MPGGQILMYKYHGYWFYWVRYDEILKARSLSEEYCLLNCPQECYGPFKSYEEAITFRNENPNLSEEFNKMLQDFEEMYYS